MASATETAAAALTTAFRAVWKRDPTESELLILLAHGANESGWGRASYLAWPEDQTEPPKTSDKNALRWKDTNNWGAVQYVGQSNANGWKPILDTHNNGAPYRAKLATYATSADGAIDFVLNATKYRGRDKTVLAFMGSRNPYEYAYRQFQNPGGAYFELAPSKAGASFAANARNIAKALGWAPPVESPQAPPFDGSSGHTGLGMSWLPVVAGAALLVAVLRRR
jgi:hypothetical protein